jgi:glycosyltransferase involved in cell wall biosynthesis
MSVLLRLLWGVYMCVAKEVWIVNQYATTPDQPGSSRHFDFARGLVQRGWKVRILASDFNLKTREYTKLNRGQPWMDEIIDGITYTWIMAPKYERNDWRRLYNMIGFAANFIAIATKLSGDPDCIVGSSPQPLAARAAQIVAHRRKCGYVLELRDLWPQAIVDMGLLAEDNILVWGARMVERKSYRGDHAIIVFAEGMQDYLSSKGVGHERMHFIPTGANTDEYVPLWEKPPQSSLSNDTNSVITVMYTGAHGSANGLDAIIEAADRLRCCPRIRFALVGDGPQKESLKLKAHDKRLRNIEFWDPVPKSDMPQLLGRADVGLITLKAASAFEYAISPNKLFEYMAAGLPVLCAIPGDMARLVRDSGAGITVSPENPDEIAEAALMLARLRPEQRIDMGRCGRELVEKAFDRARLIDQFEKVILSAPQDVNTRVKRSDT